MSSYKLEDDLVKILIKIKIISFFLFIKPEPISLPKLVLNRFKKLFLQKVLIIQNLINYSNLAKFINCKIFKIGH